MAAGCAVVTTNSTGCAETVGDAGVLVEAKNVSSLKNGLTRLILQEELISHLQRAAHDRLKQVFSLEHVVECYLTLF